MMRYKLVIAEKPSVAQSLAAVIGATARKDGYLEGNGWRVSWCVGHLAGLVQPLGAATRVPFLRGSRHPPAPTKKPQRIKIRCGFVLGSLSERQPPALLVE